MAFYYYYHFFFFLILCLFNLFIYLFIYLFTTLHGENACDGIGGMVKREAAKASLQATTSGQILTPKDLIENVHTYINKVSRR